MVGSFVMNLHLALNARQKWTACSSNEIPEKVRPMHLASATEQNAIVQEADDGEEQVGA